MEAAGMNTRVMLVGRDTPFMETLNRRLAFGGFRIFFVQTASEVLAMVHNNDIDVVVVNMDDVEHHGLRLLATCLSLLITRTSLRKSREPRRGRRQERKRKNLWRRDLMI